MAIDNPLLLSFCNESLRPYGDLLAGLVNVPETLKAAVQGKGIAAILGTTDAELFRSNSWQTQDYAAITPHVINGSDSDARTLLANHDVIGLIRVLVVLGQMIDANPQLRPLVAKFAVNPRV